MMHVHMHAASSCPRGTTDPGTATRETEPGCTPAGKEPVAPQMLASLEIALRESISLQRETQPVAITGINIIMIESKLELDHLVLMGK